MDKNTLPFGDVRFLFIIFACKKKRFKLIGDASSDLKKLTNNYISASVNDSLLRTSQEICIGFDLIKVVKIFCNKVVFFTTCLAPTFSFQDLKRTLLPILNECRSTSKSKQSLYPGFSKRNIRENLGGVVGVGQTIKEYY